MRYEDWLRQLAQIVGYDDPEMLEEDYPQVRALLYDGKLSPNEAADAFRTGM